MPATLFLPCSYGNIGRQGCAVKVIEEKATPTALHKKIIVACHKEVGHANAMLSACHAHAVLNTIVPQRRPHTATKDT